MSTVLLLFENLLSSVVECRTRRDMVGIMKLSKDVRCGATVEKLEEPAFVSAASNGI